MDAIGRDVLRRLGTNRSRTERPQPKILPAAAGLRAARIIVLLAAAGAVSLAITHGSGWLQVVATEMNGRSIGERILLTTNVVAILLSANKATPPGPVDY